MYKPKAIQTSFQKLIGFLPPNDPNTPKITGDLLLSDTGIFVSNVHALCTLDYLYFAAPDFSLSKFYAWVSGSDYAIGAIAIDGNLLYKALVGITNSVVAPSAAAPGIWAVYDPWQNYVQQLYNQAASNLIAAVVQRKKLLKMGKAILERQQLYRGVGLSSDTIVNMDNFVGFIIDPAAAEGLIISVDLVGIQATQPQEELNFYLYHSSRLGAPLQIFHVPIESAGVFDWQTLTDTDGKPCILGYMGLDGTIPVDTEGSYIFGYHQQDLVGQAIHKTWDCAAVPCTCDNANINMYNKWSRYTRFRNVMIPGRCFDGDYNLLSTNSINYGNSSNYGINLSLTVRCDLTKTITDNRFLWGQAFSKSVAYEMLKVIAYSPRINPGEGGIKQAAMADLDTMIPGAFIHDFLREVDCVNMDLSGFSAACMPEDDTERIEWLPGI